jgi:hypothetical protein
LKSRSLYIFYLKAGMITKQTIIVSAFYVGMEFSFQ